MSRMSIPFRKRGSRPGLCRRRLSGRRRQGQCYLRLASRSCDSKNQIQRGTAKPATMIPTCTARRCPASAVPKIFLSALNEADRRRIFLSLKQEGFMRILLLIASALLAGPALSQTCTNIGATVYCDNGLTGSSVGGTTYWSDGVTSSRIGGTTYWSDGTAASRVGGSTYYSDGTTATRIGGTTYFSDGVTCSTIGNTSYCN